MAKAAKPTPKKIPGATKSSGDAYKDIGIKEPKPHWLSKYSEKIVSLICERIISGESLRKICADKDMPSKSTVLLWLTKCDEFRTKYALAREAQGDALLEEMGEIEDDLIAGRVDPSAARAALWSKQYRASRQAPKKYGDKITLAGDSENPLKLLLSQLPTGSIKPVDEGDDE